MWDLLEAGEVMVYISLSVYGINVKGGKSKLLSASFSSGPDSGGNNVLRNRGKEGTEGRPDSGVVVLRRNVVRDQEEIA